MLPFENLVADYVNNTGNHVLYRVTPMFSGSNLVANGVLIEAKSVEDNGGGILFNVYCYNVQPGVGINYENGDSWLDGTTPQQSAQTDTPQNEGSQSSAGSGAGESGSSGSTTGSASSAQTAQQQKIALQIPQTARLWFISQQPARNITVRAVAP